MAAVIFIILIGILILCILASCIKIVPQAYAVVLERLGAYRTTWIRESILKCRLLNAWQDR